MGGTRTGRILRPAAAVLLAGALLAASPAAAGLWCGENGTIRFSFTAGDSLVSVWDAGEPQGGVTRVDLYAWLTDVEPTACAGEAFLALGGFELKLDVSGAEAFIIGQEFPAAGLNVGNQPGTVAYGLSQGLSLREGRVLLVHWQLMFQGRPQDVRVGLDPQGLASCPRTAGCAESGTCGLYIGSATSRQLDKIFGVGFEPAWLNPGGEVDRTEVHGRSSWRDVGVFQPR